MIHSCKPLLLYIHIYIHIIIRAYVQVCVCVCPRDGICSCNKILMGSAYPCVHHTDNIAANTIFDIDKTRNHYPIYFNANVTNDLARNIRGTYTAGIDLVCVGHSGLSINIVTPSTSSRYIRYSELWWSDASHVVTYCVWCILVNIPFDLSCILGLLLVRSTKELCKVMLGGCCLTRFNTPPCCNSVTKIYTYLLIFVDFF